MKYKEIIITPKYAKAMLDKHEEVLQNSTLPPNRRYEPKRAQFYASQMKNGDWQNNGEDMHIAKSGRILNGQHRLHAIIMSGVSLKMGIKYDIDDSVFIYDRGRMRSSSDTLTMKGIDKEITGNFYVSIVRLHYYYQKGLMYVSDADIERFICKHDKTFKEIRSLMIGKNSTNKGTRINMKNAVILTAVMYALEAGIDFETINSFCEVLYTGIPQNLDQNAALVLRNDIMGGALKSAGGIKRSDHIPAVEKAIYDFVNHYQRKVSYKNCHERIYSKVFKED